VPRVLGLFLVFSSESSSRHSFYLTSFHFLSFSIMADLTVLVSPAPLYVPKPRPLTFAFASPKRNSAVSRPVTPMITLEKTHNRSPSGPSSNDHSLLSPPINTWKSRPQPRPASAPPTQTTFNLTTEDTLADFSAKPPRPIFRRRNSSFSPSSKLGEPIRPPPPLRPFLPFYQTKGG
jgi:hypothetical protein